MEIVYERNMMESAAAKDKSICGYDWSDDESRYSQRVGADPLRISAKQIFGHNRTDLVISDDDALRIFSVPQNAELLKNGKIVSGASSYTRYREGIEIEVDTAAPERRNHLATVACAALILRCLEEGLYPSWDAHNMDSVRLAEKLGYKFSHAYTAYEVDSALRTH